MIASICGMLTSDCFNQECKDSKKKKKHNWLILWDSRFFYNLEVTKAENWHCPLLIIEGGELARAKLESPPWRQRLGELTGWLILQLPRPKTRVMCWSTVICWGVEVGWGLWTQGCRISMTQGNNMMSRKSPNESLALMVQQKPGALNEIHGSLWWMPACKSIWTKGFTMWLPVSHCSCHDSFSPASFSPLLNFVFVLIWGVYGGGEIARHDVKDPKNK